MVYGLQNLGNTCYLNAGIQLILHNTDLCKIIIKNSNISDKLFRIAMFIQTQNKIPDDIKNLVEEENTIFRGYQQQDSTEFILTLLNIIDTEFKKINYTIKNIIGVQINSRIKCKIRTCLSIYNTREISNFLLFDIDNSINTLDDAYIKFRSHEKLENDNMFYCDKCKEKRIASKRNEIISLPKNLYIWLKRFTHNGQKNNQFIEIPFTWNNMKLYGAIIHYGNINGGHYIYIGNYNDKWYKCDDNLISEISTIEVNNILKNAYWLYYKNNVEF